jgi:hypothetical protein
VPTKFDADAIAAAGWNIARLMEDPTAFDALRQPWLPASGFEAAAGLDRIVDDRRSAVVAHTAHLESVYAELGARLGEIADRFKTTDGENAEEIRKVAAGTPDDDGTGLGSKCLRDGNHGEPNHVVTT